MVLGFITFVAALAGFLWLGLAAQSGETRVLVASHTISVGEMVQATTADLSPGGELVHLGATAERDAIPETSYRSVQGAVALVTIPAGALILRHDLAFDGGSALRQVTLDLSFVPPGLRGGDRVDLFAVSGPEDGGGTEATDLCSGSSDAGCVVPLAQSLSVLAADPAAHSITISVTPSRVAPWLLIDATQSIWAVPAGALACEGTEQAISDPYQALLAIRQGTAAASCRTPQTAGRGG